MMRWFYNVRTRNKLLLGFGLMTFFVLLVAGAGYQGLKAVNARLAELHDKHFHSALFLSETGSKLNAVRAHLLGMIDARDRESKQKLHARIKELSGEIDASFERLLGGSLGGDVKVGVSRAQKLWQEFKETRDSRLIPAIYEGRLEEARALATGIQAERFWAFSSEVARLMQDVREQLRHFEKEVKSRYTYSVALFFGFSGLAALMGVAMAFLYARMIARPLEKAVIVLKDVAGGDFTRRLDINTRDEVGDLASAFNLMAGELEAAWEEERWKRNELLAFNSVARAVGESLDLDRILSTALEMVLEVVDADSGIVYLWDSEEQLLRVRAHRGLSPAYVSGVDRIRMGEGLVGTVAESGEPAVVEDVQNDPRIIRPQYVRGEGIRSVLMVPLKSNTAVLGMFYVATRRLSCFTPRDIELMVSVGHQIAMAVENASLFGAASAHAEALSEKNRQLLVLHIAARFLSTEHDPGRLLQRIVSAAAELAGARYGALAVLDESGSVRNFHTYGLNPEEQEKIGPPPEGRGLLGLVFREGKTLRLDDLAAHPGAAGVPPHHPVMRSLLAVPIRHQERILGALYLTEKEGGFTADDEELVTTLCSDAAVAIENARLVEELKAALGEVKAAQERVVRATTLSAVGELAAGAAHHLNNILAVIVGRAQILLRTVKDPAVERALKIVERAALDGAEVVRRVQQFSRARAGGELVPMDLNQIAGDALEFTRPRWQDEAQSQGRLIEAALEAGAIPQVLGQPSELREVIINLILNAVDALPEGGRIFLATRREGPRVSLSVTDNGTGMSQEVKARAFEPFFTTKGVKSTGLGLSVIHGIVQRHGGEIALESEEGKGTTVTVRLPVSEREEVAAKARLSDPVHSARILLIDDEPNVREALADQLAIEGHSVTSAADGWQGLAVLEEGKPFDLVITDLGMPGMNGWEVAEVVRARFPGMPVVLVTGWASTLEPGEEKRVDGVLNKPFQIEAVRELLDRLLSAKHPAISDQLSASG
jgi:signal transduction histidine kinase/CheY-like chemotaxis protein